MNKPETSLASGRDHLSVIHKTPVINNNWLFHLHDAVIQTDLHFIVTGWNMSAEQLHGQSGAMGKNLFELADIEFIDSSLEILKKELAISGCWGGEVIFSRFDGQKILLQSTANYVYNENKEAKAIVFVSHNITDAKQREEKLALAEEALRKSNERFEYAARVTSDAIWDVDMQTNQIYRSRAFNVLSGYAIDETETNLNWWFDKIHPDDKERVKKKIDHHLENGISNWQDEYRFQCADGTFKYLIDRGIILFHEKKPVRIIGAIEDITERKKLEERIIQDEIQKQKQINQAIIAAQEKERNKISEELHDNVNQILMSAKLFMGAAQKTPEQAESLLQKAMDYQTMALEEIRRLSKFLNNSLIKTVGLKGCITDILYNLRTLKNLNTELEYDPDIDRRLSDDQKLMLFRIVQEQTSNIVKYSNAKNILVLLKSHYNTFSLVINDDGEGFDPDKKRNGIGLTNIKNRTSAYNGEMVLESSPGKGCRLDVIFPF